MIFWAVAGLLCVMAVVPVIAALVRSGRASAPASDLAVYRDQLAEVERDLARGVLTDDEAERTRIEVQRRLLEADKTGGEALGDAPAALNGAMAVGVAVAVLTSAIAVYSWQGAPGYPDLPLKTRLELAETARANRPSQADAEAGLPPIEAPQPDAKFVELMDQLRAALKDRPDDLRGHRLLARNEAAMGNFAAAAQAQARVVDILDGEATANDLAQLGELRVTAAGGYVSPEGEAAFDAALALSANNGTALYYKGVAHNQAGRFDLAFAIWRPLLEQSPPDAPWVDPIRADIEEIARRAGIRYALPALAQPGPDADALADAASMTPQERAAMIQNMVAGLADRLANEGGPASDWARLIAAYGVLGQQDQARAIYAEARDVFAALPEDLQILRAAADRAGLIE